MAIKKKLDRKQLRKNELKYYRLHREEICKKLKEERDVKREFIVNYKKQYKCAKCGFSNWKCLDFHHIGKKKFSLSKATWGHYYSLEEIQKEMDKCILLCKNCHILLHWDEIQKGQANLLRKKNPLYKKGIKGEAK